MMVSGHSKRYSTAATSTRATINADRRLGDGAVPEQVDGAHAAYKIENKLDFTSEVSMAKHFVGQQLVRTRSFIQVHGALGYLSTGYTKLGIAHAGARTALQMCRRDPQMRTRSAPSRPTPIRARRRSDRRPAALADLAQVGALMQSASSRRATAANL